MDNTQLIGKIVDLNRFLAIFFFLTISFEKQGFSTQLFDVKLLMPGYFNGFDCNLNAAI